jgi:hypothetical protein
MWASSPHWFKGEMTMKTALTAALTAGKQAYANEKTKSKGEYLVTITCKNNGDTENQKFNTLEEVAEALYKEKHKFNIDDTGPIEFSVHYQPARVDVNHKVAKAVMRIHKKEEKLKKRLNSSFSAIETLLKG